MDELLNTAAVKGRKRAQRIVIAVLALIVGLHVLLVTFAADWSDYTPLAMLAGFLLSACGLVALIVALIYRRD